MIKKLFSYLKYYKKETILAIIFVVLETLLEIVVPFLMNFILQNNLGIFYGSDQVITKVNYVVVYSVGGAMSGLQQPVQQQPVQQQPVQQQPMQQQPMQQQPVQQQPAQQQSVEPNNQEQPNSEQTAQEDPYEKLSRLKKMLDEKLITQEDYDEAKQKILGV